MWRGKESGDMGTNLDMPCPCSVTYVFSFTDYLLYNKMEDLELKMSKLDIHCSTLSRLVSDILIKISV